MRRAIGFSTGAVAKSDFRAALAILRQWNFPAIELSTLRDNELRPFLEAINCLDMSHYKYISVHAPSAFVSLSEREVANYLATLLPRRWPIVVHPDVITDWSLWERFEEWLCIENMDKRKLLGRTVAELEMVFQRLPRASFCFDIGHARQVDPTMSEAALILRKFKTRLRQVHMSEVSSLSRHEGISLTALRSFRKVAHLIRRDIPVILETSVPADQIELQVCLAEESLTEVTQNLPAPHDCRERSQRDGPAKTSSTAT